MPRQRTHAAAQRTKTVTIRLTPDEHLRRTGEARTAGLTLSGLCERLVCDGTVQAARGYQAMDPALFAELRRIGNNANQIAHALNSNLPPDVQFAWRTVNDLLRALGQQEMAAQQGSFVSAIAEALNPRTPANDPPSPQARHVFQRSVQLHPPRRGSGDH